MIVLAVWHPQGAIAALTSWDGDWYLKIADSGYDLGASPDAHGHLNPYTPRAFFPGYPLLTHWLAVAWQLNTVAAGLLVSLAAGIFAAYGLARLGRIVRGGSTRAGLILVALFAAGPMAVSLSMSYTEALFCALAVWALVGVLEERWVLAAVCCLAAGLVRSTALALIVAVVVAAATSLLRRQDSWRPAVALACAPAGLAAYLWWTGLQVQPNAGLAGQLRTWSDLEQQGWNTVFDGGVSTWNFLRTALVSPTGMTLLTAAVIMGALVLTVVAVARRVEWPLMAYAVGVVVMTVGSSGLMHSKLRLLLPAFPLLLPVALGLSNRRTGTVVSVLCGAAVASAWFGGYALVVWKYAI